MVNGEPSIVIVLTDPLTRADIPGLCARACQLLRGSDEHVVVCDVAGIGEPDAVTVDALARLQLTAKRSGRKLRVQPACAELQELIDLAGLTDVVLFGRA